MGKSSGVTASCPCFNLYKAKQAVGDNLKVHVVNLLRQLKRFLGRKKKKEEGNKLIDPLGGTLALHQR